MKKYVYLFFIAFTGMLHAQPAKQATQTAFTLNEAVDYALKNNYDHKNQVLDNSIMYERIKEVITTGLPNINASASYRNNFYLPTSILPGEIIGKPGTTVPVQFGTSNNLDFNVELQQLIFDGRYLVGLQARRMMKTVSEQGVKVSEANVRALIKKTYFTAMVAKESKEILKQNRSILSKLLEDNKKVYQEGLIEELDVDRLTLALANLEKEITAAEGRYELALVGLKFNMGYKVEDPIELKDSLDGYFPTYASFIPNNNYDIKNRAEYKLLSDNIELKGYDIKQQKAAYYPSLFGVVSTGTQAQRNAFNFFNNDRWFYYGFVGIKLNVPIWDGGTKKFRLEQTRLGIDKSKVDFEKFQFAAKTEALMAQINFYTALKDFRTSTTNLELAQKINRKAKIMFKEGIGSSFELANSETELVKSTLNLIQSKYSLIISKLDYDKAIGAQ